MVESRRHNGRNGASNHQPPDCLLNRLFGRRWKKTSKLRVTGLCAGNSSGEFPAQMDSNAENVSIWWRHHASRVIIYFRMILIFVDNAWVCSWWYLKSLSALHKPALVASILPSQERHIGYWCCSSWHSRWSFRDKLSFPFEDAEGRVISTCEIFSEEISRIVSSIAEISITSRFLSNIIMIVIMRRTLVCAKCFIRYNPMQSSLFFFYMLVSILHAWLTKLTNDRNNRKESWEILSSWFN